MKLFVLAFCLLVSFSCVKPPGPQPASSPAPVLPQYRPLAELFSQFQGFRDDPLYQRHGFTANFPQSDWLPRVQALAEAPDLAEPARLLAGLAIAYRIHGAQAMVTRDFETRFSASIRGHDPQEQQGDVQAPVGAGRLDEDTAPNPGDVQLAEVQPPAPTAAPATLPRQSPDGMTDNTPDTLTLLFSGDTQGVIYPQPGISAPVGGIARRGPVIEKIRTENPGVILVDAGDSFTSGFAKAEKINMTLVQAMNRMGYDAMGLGHHDLAMGEIALRGLVSAASFPVVCTNLSFDTGTTPWISDHAVIHRGGMRVAIVSLLSEDMPVRVTGARLMPPDQALANILPRLRVKADCVILLTQIDGRHINTLPGVLTDITAVFGDCRASPMESPLYLPTVPKGLGIGLLRLQRSDKAGFQPVQSFPLLTGEKQDPELARMLEELKD